MDCRQKIIATDGNTPDCTMVEVIIDGVLGACLMADKAHDTNALLERCANNE
jgi:hypothetical protein